MNLLEDGEADDHGEIEGEGEEEVEETVHQGEFWGGEDGQSYWAGPDEHGVSSIYVAVGSGKAMAWKKLGSRSSSSSGGQSSGSGGARPSADRPCRICGGTDHWGNECPQNPSKGRGKRKGKRGRGGRNISSTKVANSEAAAATAASESTGGNGEEGPKDSAAPDTPEREDGEQEDIVTCEKSAEVLEADAAGDVEDEPLDTNTGVPPRTGLLTMAQRQ